MRLGSLILNVSSLEPSCGFRRLTLTLILNPALTLALALALALTLILNPAMAAGDGICPTLSQDSVWVRIRVRVRVRVLGSQVNL